MKGAQWEDGRKHTGLGSSLELALTGLVDRSDGVEVGEKENGSKAVYGATGWLVVLLSAYPFPG